MFIVYIYCVIPRERVVRTWFVSPSPHPHKRWSKDSGEVDTHAHTALRASEEEIHNEWSVLLPRVSNGLSATVNVSVLPYCKSN